MHSREWEAECLLDTISGHVTAFIKPRSEGFVTLFRETLNLLYPGQPGYISPYSWEVWFSWVEARRVWCLHPQDKLIIINAVTELSI